MLQPLDLGAAADDGTGTVLRDGGALINANFQELYDRPWLAPVLATLPQPPLSPTPQPGARYLVATPAVGDFTGREGQIAEAVSVPGGLAWAFLTPADGAVLWHAAEGRHLRWTGGAWSDFTPPVPALPMRLAAIAALPPTAAGLLNFPTAATAATVPFAEAARSLLAAVNAAGQRSVLGLGSAAQFDLGVPGGVASLDGAGRLNPAQIPDLTITDVFVVASAEAMLALSAERGDVAVRSDLARSFILRAEPATLAANWVELPTPPDAVLSVFGRGGVISAAAGDYRADQITVTPSPTLTATNVQAALAELDAGKTATPLADSPGTSLGSAASGTASAASRADHRHDHGVQAGGDLHAPASPSGDGFMTAADKRKLDAVPVEPDGGALRGYIETVQGPLDVAGAVTLPDPAGGNLYDLRLTGDATVTLPGITAPSGTALTIHVLLRQDAAGNHAVSWAAAGGDSLLWDQSTTPPTLATAPNGRTLLVLTRFADLGLWLGARVWKEV